MSELENTLAGQLRLRGVRGYEREYVFHPRRRWRADFAWPAWSLLVECEGAVYSGGRHVRGKGFENDTEKYNTATLMGWRVLRFTEKAIKRGEAADLILAVLEGRWEP